MMFEYILINYYQHDENDFFIKANNLGVDGWEIVGVIPSDNCSAKVIFKRQKND